MFSEICYVWQILMISIDLQSTPGWNQFKPQLFASVLIMTISIVLYAKESIELLLRFVRLRLGCAAPAPGRWRLLGLDTSRGLSIGDLPTNYAWFCGKMEEECDEPLDGRGCPIFWTKSHMICRSSVCMHRWNMIIMIVSIHIVDTLKCW